MHCRKSPVYLREFGKLFRGRVMFHECLQYQDKMERSRRLDWFIRNWYREALHAECWFKL